MAGCFMAWTELIWLRIWTSGGLFYGVDWINLAQDMDKRRAILNLG
jgi:hypothetical protein